MKKLLLLIPVGLLAATGIFWANLAHNEEEGVALTKSLPQYPQELFALSEHSLRQVVRYGDEKSLLELKNSLDKLDSSLAKYKERGLLVGSTREMIVQYRQDSEYLTKAATPYLKKLDTYNDFERDNEKSFALSLDQIGLYELKAANLKLNQVRLEYIKGPSQQTQQAYIEIVSKMKQMIAELYLDSVIEQPLFAYMDNHNNYFKTVVSIYEETGTQRVYRLEEKGYAIKTQLQLLPKL